MKQQELTASQIKEYKLQAENYIYQIILQLEKKTNLNVDDLEFFLNEDDEIGGVNLKLVFD